MDHEKWLEEHGFVSLGDGYLCAWERIWQRGELCVRRLDSGHWLAWPYLREVSGSGDSPREAIVVMIEAAREERDALDDIASEAEEVLDE